MRTTPMLAGLALALVAAGAAVAASPSPSPSASPSPTPAPTATPAPSTSPGTTSGSSGSSSAATAGQTWSAAVKPLDVTTGTATLVSQANGRGMLTIKLHGLVADARWTVDVDGGTVAQPREGIANDIAFRSGLGVERISSDTVRIHLTKQEMKDFLAAQAKRGVVVLVSDGRNQAAAVFTG